MTKRAFVIVAVLALATLGFFALVEPSYVQRLTQRQPEERVCTREAKICPDGSSVGRTGPNCEFAACPEESGAEAPAPGTSVTVSARLGESVVALGEIITPIKILEDSRCPLDVQCVWAGTVRVDGTVRGGMGLGQLTFELGKTSTTEVNAITLTAVEPAQKSTATIEKEGYIFTFRVTRR